MRYSFAYIRRSSYKQQENNSFEIQTQHIQEFAKRNHLIVPDEFIFIEDVTSAFTKKAGQRRELMRLASKMVETGIPVVIFYDISRMDRTGYTFTIDFYRPLKEKLPNLEVYTTESSIPIDPESSQMKLNFLVYENESIIKSERALGSLLTTLKSKKSIRPGATIPYGYSLKEGKLYTNEKADIVSFIFFLYSWGHSLKRISLLLNQMNIPSPKGKQWNASTIENIVKNPTYTGKLIWEVPKSQMEEKIFEFNDAHEPIVNESLIYIHNYNKALLKRFGRFDTPFLFLNKLTCKDCQGFLTTENGSTKRNGKTYHYQYYVCKQCKYKIGIEQVHAILLPLILGRVEAITASLEIKEQTLEIVNKMEVAVDNLISENENRISLLLEKQAIAKQLNDRELELHIVSSLIDYKDSLETQQNCREDLKQSFHLVDSNNFFPRFRNILEHSLDVTEKRLIILYFIDNVLVSPDHRPTIQFKSNIFDVFSAKESG